MPCVEATGEPLDNPGGGAQNIEASGAMSIGPKGIMMRWGVAAICAVLILIGAVWLAEILRANTIARRDFGPNPCWLAQKDSPRLPPGLVVTGRKVAQTEKGQTENGLGKPGTYLPNPLQQLNRRILHIGVADTGVTALHFAVAARDAKGQPDIWAWSYRTRAFWSVREAAQDSAFYYSIDADEILAACPDLPTAAVPPKSRQ